MAELIGAVFGKTFSRRDLLTFDRIAWEKQELFMRNAAAHPASAPLVAELQFLIDRGVLYSPTIGDIPLSAQTEIAAIASELTDSELRRISSPDDSSETSQAALHLVDISTRSYAVEVRHMEVANVVPIVLGWQSSQLSQRMSRTDVVQLVLDELPIPDDTHGLEDILAFRDEARAEGLVQGLRVWIHEMASGKLTPIEVADKLEDLMFRYERTLKLEKMRRDTGMVETLVTTTAEIAEHLVRFKWSKLAERLFSVRYKQIDLMKAEMSAPGREVAYIVKARERFGR
jgi:hypothetical protein